MVETTAEGLTKGLGTLALYWSSTPAPAFDFLEFFKTGSAGRNVFDDFILPYLSLKDLVWAAASCRQMNTMCRTYTVADLMMNNSLGLSRAQTIELDKLVMFSVSPQYHKGDIQRRFVRTSNAGSFWARLYHPSQFPEMELDIAEFFAIDEFDWNANTDASTPVLVSATFGDKMYYGNVVDVTVILRFLLMKQGNQDLAVLSHFDHWDRYGYICLFGDPHISKVLTITVRLENGLQVSKDFPQNSPLFVKLRAEVPENARDEKE